MEERDFHEIEFPLTIKVCVSPGFNDTALQEVGYTDTFYYFLGESRYNDSIYGWGGHTNTSEVFGSVLGVLERVKNHVAKDIIQSAHVWTTKREHIDIPIEQLKTPRVNYPHNCYSLDLSNVTQEYEVKELFLYFQNLENKTVEVLLRDTNMDCSREVKDHSFYSIGDTIRLTESQVAMAYMVEMSKNVFVKEDPSKRCTDYPTDKFKSYKECDDQFMRKLLADVSPDLLPIWLTDNVENASSLVVDTSGDFGEKGHFFFFSVSLELLGLMTQKRLLSIRCPE